MKIEDILNKMNVVLESSGKDIKATYSMNVSISGDGEGEVKAKGSGSFFIPKDIVRNLVSVEDIINYLIKEEVDDDITKKGNLEDQKSLLTEVLILLLNDENDKLIQREDFINFSLDYGTEISNSVGIFLTKQKNSPAFSRIMRLNGKALQSKFNLNALNNKILYYSTLGE